VASIVGRTVKATDTRPLKALFFGPSKSGKTTLAGTAPKVLFLDVEGGTMSLRSKDVDVFPIKTWADVDDALKTLTLEKHPWQSVVIDSITQLQEVAGEVAGLNAAIAAGDDPRRAYGGVGAMVRHKILQFNNLPMNVVFLAQLRERDGQDMEAGQYPLTPDVTPAILRTLMAAPDVIGRTLITQVGAASTDVEYRVRFGPEALSQVGHRDLALPKEVKGLTIPKLIAMTKEVK
jgi:hypothetical protein